MKNLKTIMLILKEAKKRRKIYAAIAAMSVIALLIVMIVLVKPGIAMTQGSAKLALSNTDLEQASENGASTEPIDVSENEASTEPTGVSENETSTEPTGVSENEASTESTSTEEITTEPIAISENENTSEYTSAEEGTAASSANDENENTVELSSEEVSADLAATSLEGAEVIASGDLLSLSATCNCSYTIYNTTDGYMLYFEPVDSSLSYTIPNFVTSTSSRLYYQKAPWYTYCNEITAIEAADGLTSIGNYAFRACTSLKEVNFGEESPLTSIGTYAFYGCTALEAFPFEELPQVTTIGEGAFYNCTSLQTADLSNMTSLTAIPGSMFRDCTSLTDINFGEDSPITSIGSRAFAGCTALEAFPFEELPQVTTIGSDAFLCCRSLQTADFSSMTSLTAIPAGMFAACASLESVNLGENSPITSIGNYAFSGCSSLVDFAFENLVNLTTVSGSNNSTSTYYTATNGTRYSYSTAGAFANCTSLTSVDLSRTQLMQIPNFMFYGCSKLEEVNCSGLDELITVGQYAFYANAPIKVISFKDCPELTSFGTSVFYTNNTYLQSVDLSGCSSLTTIPASMFSGDIYLQEVNLESCTSLATIGSSAFASCKTLTEIDFPAGLETIGTSAFSGCTAIETINYNAESLTSIGANAFLGVGTTTDLTVNIGTGVNRIADDAFSQGIHVGEVNFVGINDSLIFGNGAFDSVGRPLSAMSDGTTEYYVDENGAIYSADRTVLYYIPAGITEYTVPASVTRIKADACKMADDLTTLHFEEIANITALESNALANCTTLTKITTTTDEPVTTVSGATTLFEAYGASIGVHAFYNTGLTEDVLTGVLVSDTIETMTFLEGENQAVEYRLSVGFVNRDSGTLTVEASNAKRIPSIETPDEDIYYYLTDERADARIFLSAEGAEENKVARVYFYCSSDAIQFSDYTVGSTTTITTQNGVSYQVDFKQVADSDIYYLEFPASYGNTLAFDANLYVSNLSVESANVKTWVQLVDSVDAPLELNPPTYQQAEWYTAIQTWGVKHTTTTGNENFKMVENEDEAVIRIANDLTYTINATSSYSGTAASLDSYGIDPASTLYYTEYLTLPEGITWEEDVIEAVKNGDWYCSGSGPIYVYLNTPSGRKTLMYFNSGLAATNISLEWDEERGVVVTWQKKNTKLSTTSVSSGTKYEQDNYSAAIVYNADEIFKIDTDIYDFTKTNVITSNLIQNPEYVYAKEGDTSRHTAAVFEQTASVSKVLGTASSSVTIAKRSVSGGNIFYGGADAVFSIKLANTGIVDGTTTKVWDSLPIYFVIRPDDMEAMFNDTYGKELVITIASGYQDDSLKAEESLVTGIDGTELEITPTEKGSEKAGLDTITIQWAEDGTALILTCGDTEVMIGENGAYASLQAYFDEIGFINGNSTQYSCAWYMDEDHQALAPLEEREYLVLASTKTTFEYLTGNKSNYQANSSYRNNYAYYSNKDNYTATSSAYASTYWFYELSLDKSYSINGTTGAKVMKPGDEVDYKLFVSHRGTGVTEHLPLHDTMTGAQAVLAPVAGNENAVFVDTSGQETKLPAVGLEQYIGSDGVLYYILSAEGTYRDILVGYDSEGSLLMADRIETVKSTNTLTTNVYWYINTMTGTVTETVSYKTLVNEEVGKLPNTGNLTIGNTAYLNERENDMLYSAVSENIIVFSASDFDKKIVTANAAGSNETLAEFSEVAQGDAVIYKLSLKNNSEKYPQSFTNIYDILPQTYGEFAWSKDNVSMNTVSSLGARNTTADKWKIAAQSPAGVNDGNYYIYWNDSESDTDISGNIVLQPGETLDIYVTLTFPSDNNGGKVWENYQNAAFDAGNKLVNTFVVRGEEKSVTHSLKGTGQAILQKGVYGIYDSSSYITNSLINTGTRSRYTNKTQSWPFVTYYVVIYNSGNSRLYLTDMVDTLPKGFYYRGMCAVSDYGSATSGGSSTYYDGVYYPKANSSYATYSSVLLTYPYQEGTLTSGDRNNLLACVNDANTGNPVEYVSAYVKYTRMSTTDVNGDYQQTMKFSFTPTHPTSTSSSYVTGNIGYDSEEGLCYLEKGQALVFGYVVAVPEAQFTENLADNRISMQYYDYNDAGFKLSENVKITGNYASYTDSINDGTCSLIDDFEASTGGLTGAYTTDWLTSQVSLTRGH